MTIGCNMARSAFQLSNLNNMGNCKEVKHKQDNKYFILEQPTCVPYSLPGHGSASSWFSA